MPHTESQLPTSSGFHSFTIPIRSEQQASSIINATQAEFPQTTSVTWSSTKKSLPITTPRSIAGTATTSSAILNPHQTNINVNQSANSAMSTVAAGPSVINSNSNFIFTYPNSNNQSSYSSSNTMNNNAAMNSNNSGYQYPTSNHPHSHQHSNSLDNLTSNTTATANPMYGNIASNNHPNFTGHRRVNTESAMSSMTYPSNLTGNTEQTGTQFPSTNFASASKAVSLGPLRVHQFFPTAGEAGVPVTVLATVKAEWARQVGLQLISGIYGGNEGQAAKNHGGSKFVLCFGTTDVDTRTERSIGMGDSPFNTMTTLEGTSYMSNNANAKDLDLTIIAHSPHYPGPQLNNPSQGGRVSICIKLVGAPLDSSLQELSNGLNVGEFTYWQVSPRANLKRPGDDLLAEQPGLRRPASFPALGSQNAAATRMSEQQQGSASVVQRRPGLGEMYGIGRMASAHDFRSNDSMSTISAQTMQPVQYDMGYNQGTPSYPNFVHGQTSTASPSSSLRRNSMGFSSTGAGAGSEISRPSSELPAYSIAKAHGSGGGEHGGYMGQVHDTHGSTPQLIRSTQLLPTSPPSGVAQQQHPTTGGGGYGHSYNASISTSSSSSPPTDRTGLPIPSSQRANLEIHGNIQDMAVGWSHEEWRARRRLVQFWRKQEGTTIHAICKPILPEEYIPNSVVVSCIFWDVTNECYITSVDVIYLLEALVASRFNVEEKNRIRRNLEGLKPKTISKIAKSEDPKVNKIHEEFFKLVMSFPNPKPRHIEKDIKIFPWRVLASALNKIISKYSAAPLVAAANMQYAAAAAAASSSSGGMHPPHTAASFPMHTPHYPHTQMGDQQSAQRRFPSGLSIDVDASNAAYTPSSSAPASNVMYQQHQQQQQAAQQPQAPSSSSLQVPPSFGRGASFSSSFGIGNYLSGNSPRKMSSSGGLPGSSTFNFSDFVVSPVAFGQTPLQQAQSLGHYPATPNQPSYHSQDQQPQHAQSHGAGGSNGGGQTSGLGMDLGNVYKPES